MSHPPQVTTVLSLTACSDEQFTCHDGLCVPLQDRSNNPFPHLLNILVFAPVSRCDGVPNCLDRSDELECRVLEPDSSYNRFLAPPPNKPANKVKVDISVTIMLLNAFNIIGSSFDLEFSIANVWVDSRLSFNNLRLNRSSNMMGPQDKAYIWFPKFVFENTQQKLESLVDGKALLTVERKGKGVLADNTFTENKLLYAGGESPIHYERIYNEQFNCEFQLSWYPFDRQHCSIVIQPTNELINHVDLVPDVFKYLGPKNLRQYLVTEIKMTKKGNSVVVTVSISRMLMSIILTTILPTVILNLIGHTANYFKAFFFEAIIALNASVMLVLTTMFINVSNNLPKTAYIKMIDIWLLFNLFKPFVDIIMQTYIENLKTEEGEKRDVNHHGKVVQVGQAIELR